LCCHMYGLKIVELLNQFIIICMKERFVYLSSASDNRVRVHDRLIIQDNQGGSITAENSTAE
jgi:hypothetical protein